MADLLIYDFPKIAFAAAQYWPRQLDARYARPGNLRDALYTAIVDAQQKTNAEVVLCSRPERYLTPGYTGVNVLAVVAYDLKLPLEAFKSALIRVYVDRPPVLWLHPHGHPRPLLVEYPLQPPAVTTSETLS